MGSHSLKILKLLTGWNRPSRRHVVYGLLIALVLLISTVKLASISPYNPTSKLQYFRAKILNVRSQTSQYGAGQIISAKIIDGPDKDRVFSIARSTNFGDVNYNRVPVGSEILLSKDATNGNQYSYEDRWRIPGVASLTLIFLILVIAIGWWRGITSVFGLVISIGVLALYVIPAILAGHSPYIACIIGAFVITAVSIYVAHGFSRRTSVAFASSILTLVVVLGLVALATYLAGSSEVIDENSLGLGYASHPISLAALLSGGIIIASLGVLYDITTAQAAAVDEIYKANKKQSALKLYKRGLSVGREHIAALVNTLALVYVGIALPSIAVTALYSHAPLITTLNSEAIIEEIIRTFVASVGMLLAVPITTGLAAYVLPKWYT